MKHDLNRLSLAVRLALCAGIFSVAGAAQAQATTPDNPQSTDQTAPPSKKDAKTLQSVVVTGSLIKRVDVETASHEDGGQNRQAKQADGHRDQHGKAAVV